MPLLLLVFGLLLLPISAAALQITSISPSLVSAGDTVTLTGGPFSAEAQILVGEARLTPQAPVQPNRLTFTVPDLPPGDYMLQVRQQERQSAAFSLRIVSPPPRIAAIQPDILDSCRVQHGTTVTVSGRFPAGTRLLLNGTVVAAASVAQSEFFFRPPPLPDGMHQIEAVNLEGVRSLPYPLVVEGVPRIHGIQQGQDMVTSYEVIITGENFLYNSTLVVNDEAINVPAATEGAPVLPRHMRPRADVVRYIDCNTLVYIRHPHTREPRALTLQVVNPGGLQSQPYQVTLP